MSDLPPPSEINVDALVPGEMAERAERVGVAKAELPASKTFVLAVLAGAFIGLGAVFATTVTAGGGLPYGVSKLLGGLVFCLGLILVVVAGAELFTGNNLIVMAWASRRISTAKLLRNWGIVYAGNFVGSVATAALVVVAGQYTSGGGVVGANVLAIADAKCQLGFTQAFALGVLCNALVCLAIWLCFSARSTTDKVLCIIFPITAFVAAGFEHSIANMYFIPAALFVQSSAGPDFWSAIGTAPGAYEALSWAAFAKNLVPVTLGNIVGGSLMVGAVYWFVYGRSPVEANSGDNGAA